jgi:hypothetical protein
MNLDVQLFNYFYQQCKSLGGVFGFGAFEGLVLYAGAAAWGIISLTNAKKVRK